MLSQSKPERKTMSSRKEHWDKTYETKAIDSVSWFQSEPDISLRLIESGATERRSPIIDVGGGASRLIDHLLALAYDDVTVLDISEVALTKARQRLGPMAGRVAWICADIREWQPPRKWQVWHDRAVFHFLTDTADQNRYIAAVNAATDPGALVILATFALDGPERCSGLPVCRYDPVPLAERFGSPFGLVASERESHRTPGGTEQKFNYTVMRRR